MKFFAAISILAAVALAAPAPAEEGVAAADSQQPIYYPFHMEAFNDKKFPDRKRINANNNRFWVGKPTRSQCPEKRYEKIFGSPCPPGDQTEFAPFTGKPVSNTTDAPAKGPIFLDSLGSLKTFEAQQAYVDSTSGAMMFNTPDSKIPANAKKSFLLLLGSVRISDGSKFGYSSPKACPAKNADSNGPYQIFFDFADLPKNCFNITIDTFSDRAAFQYY